MEKNILLPALGPPDLSSATIALFISAPYQHGKTVSRKAGVYKYASALKNPYSDIRNACMPQEKVLA